MKTNYKRLLALMLSALMLVLCLPVTAMAEYTSYKDVTYETKLVENTPLTVSPTDVDPEIHVSSADWSGYAKGFTMDLTADQEYLITLNIEAPTATYLDRALAILPNTLTGTESDDILTSKTGSVYGTSFSLSLAYTPKATDTYRLLMWGWCRDDNGHLFDGVTMTVTVQKMPEAQQLQVKTAEDLAALNDTIAALDNSALIEVLVDDDIDMTGVDFTPISSVDYRLVIQGKDHTIKGMTHPLVDTVNVLTVNDLSLVQNIVVTNADVARLGGLANMADYATLNNCHVSGTIALDDVYKPDGIGGMIGRVYDQVTITQCTSAVTFSIADADYVYSVGGLIGECWGDQETTPSMIERSSWKGSIVITDVYDDVECVGGIIGYVGDYFTIQDCSVEGKITIAFTDDAYFDDYEDSVGGLVGYMEDYNSIYRSSANITVDAPDMFYMGGLVGYMDEANTLVNCYARGSINGYDYLGGLVGGSDCCGYNSFLNCYAAVDITGVDTIGGFIGHAYEGDTFINCYANGDITGPEDVTNTDVTGTDLYIGSFFGGNRHLEDRSDLTFENCYAAQNGWPISEHGGFDGITAMDFADSDAVRSLVDTMNQYAEEYNKDCEEGSELLTWTVNGQGQPGFLVEEPEPTPDPNPVTPSDILIGDVNKDTKRDAGDALMILKAAVGKETLTDEQKIAADVTGEGKIDAGDALEVLKFAVGKIQVFSVELL